HDVLVFIATARQEIQEVEEPTGQRRHVRTAGLAGSFDDHAMRQKFLDKVNGNIIDIDADIAIERRVPQRSQKARQMIERKFGPEAQDKILLTTAGVHQVGAGTDARLRLPLSICINGVSWKGFTTIAGTAPPTRTPSLMSKV